MVYFKRINLSGTINGKIIKMVKEIIVNDEEGKQVHIGDVIIFLENHPGWHSYHKATWGKALVVNITKKSLKLKPLYFTSQEKEALENKNNTYLYDIDMCKYKTTHRSSLFYHRERFFISGRCDGSGLLDTL